MSDFSAIYLLCHIRHLWGTHIPGQECYLGCVICGISNLCQLNQNIFFLRAIAQRALKCAMKYQYLQVKAFSTLPAFMAAIDQFFLRSWRNSFLPKHCSDTEWKMETHPQ